MTRKGWVQEVGNGEYVPIPPDELVKRLRSEFNSNISILEEQLREVAHESTYEYVWVIFGYHHVMERAIDMIKASHQELYVRLFPRMAKRLNTHLHAASERGVKIRYVAMGTIPVGFDVQVIHPDSDRLVGRLSGYSIDIVADRSEALVGIFTSGDEDNSPINWTRNHWFVIATRDSLRHDFYHYFLHKLYDQQQELSERERRMYDIIKSEN
jgi:sugar-specific transcriptional regulator TrmB